MDHDANPMSKAHAAPRCTATSKRTGERCKGPAVRGWRVCRFHGAGGGHSPGPDHPSWRHGMRARDWNENQVRMHRVILCAADGIDVDHIDGDGLNNRRSNLRLATKMQNGRNRFIGANNTSGIKGVYQQKKSGRWIARIKVCGASIYLGSFPDAGQAAAAYAKASAEFHGEFGRTS